MNVSDTPTGKKEITWKTSDESNVYAATSNAEYIARRFLDPLKHSELISQEAIDRAFIMILEATLNSAKFGKIKTVPVGPTID